MEKSKDQTLEHLFHVEKERLMLLDTLHEMVCLFDMKGQCLYANDVWMKAFDYSRQEIRSLSFVDMLDPSEIPSWEKMMGRLSAGAGYQNATFMMKKRAGEAMSVIGSLNSYPSKDSGEPRVLAIFQDITPYLDAQTERDRLFQLSIDLMCTMTLEGEFKQINPAFQRTLGYTERDLFGHSFLEYMDPADLQKMKSDHQGLQEGRPVIMRESRFRAQDGSIHWLAWTIHPSLPEKTLYCVIRDITLERMEKRKLERLAFTDDLTGLLNRRGFYISSSKLAEVAAREKKGFLLMLADLDDFKNINDRYGHAEGDAALTRVANILKNRFRASDVLARIGGDEFAASLMLHGDFRPQQIKQDLDQLIKKKSPAENPGYHLGISMGFAMSHPGEKPVLEDLLQEADTMMYKEKFTRHQQDVPSGDDSDFPSRGYQGNHTQG